MKNFVIIGASSGIGKELATLLAVDNQVFVYGRTEIIGDNISYSHWDAIASESLQIPAEIEQIDGLIYCPGSINLKPFHRLAEQDFLNDYKINVMGAVKAIQAFLPLLKKSGNASVLLFSTVAVQVGMPFHSSISAAKGAVEGLVKSLAAEFAPTIRVNSIAPSLTATPLAEKLISSPEKIEASNKRHPLGRFGTAKELASLAQFLLSENATWITGQIIHADGGISSVKTA
ncbi:MAG: SDR family oxidoreductase [Bacteroidetes bacterium]|nr:MAG: SDR family oxidoreductase [Bacteroidota bacterium]